VSHPEISKEAWLEQFGMEVPGMDPPKWEDTPAGCLPLCLVNNAYFSALAVCYEPTELDAFKPNERDRRPRTWWWAPVAEIRKVAPLGIYLKETS